MDPIMFVLAVAPAALLARWMFRRGGARVVPVFRANAGPPAAKRFAKIAPAEPAPKDEGPRVDAEVAKDDDCRRLAEAHLESREWMEALIALQKMSRWREQDYALALRIFEVLGKFEDADALFKRERRHILRSPAIAFRFAVFFERRGDLRRAARLYSILRGKSAAPEAELRLRRLRRLPDEDRETAAHFFRTTGRGRAYKSPSGKPEPLLAGRVAGRFEIIRPLGVGGTGIVYQARDLKLSRTVALKRLRGEISRDPEAEAAFLEEAGTLSELRHPNIVEFYEAVAAEGTTYLVFEFIEWETLRELLARRGEMRPEEAGRLLRAVAEALAFAHESRVMHRDLKPGNIVAGPQGQVKVMDFGIARHFEPGTGAEEVEVVGTPAYMAPEQHAGQSSLLSDVYAFGVTAYEMLAGRPPFVGPGAMYYSQKLEEDYERLPPDLPRNLRDLVTLCLKADPRARPQGARGLVSLLEL